mmetsp:Transcript_12301/g.27637  ORF Transcript_12301/g.27637 Transcript_12301/m.27637 type:complete len:210 (+) Transcript_12301:1037-1666(+)
MPATTISSTIRCIVRGTFSEGLRMTQLPMVREMGTVHMGTIAGKLKGTMAATTPRGSLVSTHITPLDTSRRLPTARLGRLVAHSTVSLPLATSASASVMFLPFSRTMISASSCACVSTRLWNLNIIAALALMVSPLHPSNAAFATTTASATSLAVDSGTSAMVSPVEGETTATLPVAEPCTNSPPMKFGSIDIFGYSCVDTERQGLSCR